MLDIFYPSRAALMADLRNVRHGLDVHTRFVDYRLSKVLRSFVPVLGGGYMARDYL